MKINVCSVLKELLYYRLNNFKKSIWKLQKNPNRPTLVHKDKNEQFTLYKKKISLTGILKPSTEYRDT